MKIRHPWLIKALGFGLAGAIRAWMATVRCHYRPLGPDFNPNTDAQQGRCIFVFWHENVLLPVVMFRGRRVVTLLSAHADGRLAAEVVRHTGSAVVYGSSTRGGVEALRRLKRLGRRKHVALTPDGPRGPRRRLQLGVIYLAARTGLPIVPVGIGYDKPWRLGSWDCFAIPRPGSRAMCLTAKAVPVPPDANRPLLEAYRCHVEDWLNWLSEAAEHWAESGSWSDPGPPPTLGCRRVA